MNAYFFGSRQGVSDVRDSLEVERRRREGMGEVSSEFTRGRGVRREDGAEVDGELPTYRE